VVAASLIALTSLLGAIAAWRAEVASMKGDDAERKGFADNVENEQQKARIRSSLQDDLVTYQRARSVQALAKGLREQARTASSADAARLAVEAAANEKLAKDVLSRLDTDALRPDGTLDLSRKYELEYALASSHSDLDPKPEFAGSDILAKKSERLVGLTALLIAAAFFFTLAQISRRGLKLLYLGGGLTVLLTASVLLLLVEALT
jgi:hypothetical protein